MTAEDRTAIALGKVRGRIAKTFGAWTRETTLDQMRADFDAFLASDLEADSEDFDISGIPCRLFIPQGAAPENLILYFHGGGYQIGSTRSHKDIMIRLARAAGCPVLGFDYRLAPEHRFPAAIEDAVAVWRGLLQQGRAPERVAFAGDSAGGGLAVATLLQARELGLPLPASAALMSPWLDLEASGETYTSRAELDPLSQRPALLAMARTYLGRDGDPRHPLASPIHADLSGLPPLSVHVGDHETVLDDSRVFADRLRAAGGTVELTVWPRMIHHFQLFPELPDAERSLAEIGAFLRKSGARGGLRFASGRAENGAFREPKLSVREGT